MAIVRNLKVGTKLGLLVVVFLVGLISFGAYSYTGLNTVKVNGALYNEINQGQDLVADILPPPEYIVESYLNSLEMIEAVEGNASQAELQALLDKAASLRQDYETRHSYWMTALAEGPTKEALTVAAYTPAMAFYAARDQEFIPAIEAGDLAAARATLYDSLQPAYLEHRAAIDQTVQLASDDNQAHEAAAVGIITQTITFLILIGVLCGLIVAGLGLLIARTITSPLAQVARAAEGIAAGDLDQHITVQSTDEVGQMAAAFSRMIDYLKTMATAAGRIANGDLTATVTPLTERDVLGQTLAQMIANLRRSLEQVANNAASVDAASKELAAAASEAGQATNQIANTIQQVASGTTQQSAGVSRTAQAAEEMRRAIDGVARGAQDQAQVVAGTASAMSKLAESVMAIRQAAQAQSTGLQHAERAQGRVRESLGAMQTAARSMADAAEQSARAAQAGTQRAAQSVAGMGHVRTTNDELAGRVRDLGKRTSQIGAIVEVIDEIASQTNLLALNAAIEAARAGTHGKGFAVVADEVRKLAERSAQATKEIGSMISAVQGGAAEVVTAMQSSDADVGAAASATESAGAAFAEIATETQALLKQVQAITQAADGMGQATAALEQVIREAAQSAAANAQAADAISELNNQVVAGLDNVSAVVEENTAATEQMAASSTEVTTAIENIASVSEENSAAVEEVSASTEEMSAQVAEVSSAAGALAQMAQELQAIVGQFRLTDEPALQAAPEPHAAHRSSRAPAPRYQPSLSPMGAVNVAVPQRSTGNGNGNGHKGSNGHRYQETPYR